MRHTQHNRISAGLLAVLGLALALPLVVVVAWLAYQWETLDLAMPWLTMALRVALFVAPVGIAAGYGITGIVVLWRRFAWRESIFADKQAALVRATKQIAPLATSFTYHSSSESTPDPLALTQPIATTQALAEWMVWIDEQPHTLLAGKTKAGKTHLATALLERRLRAKETIFIIDPHSSNWLSLPTAGGVSNPKELKFALVTVLAEYTRRMKERDAYKKANNGQELPIDFFPRLNVLIDECNGIAALEPDVWSTFATQLASGSRKVGIALIILAQSPNVDDIGFSAKMRNNFAAIALDAASVQQMIDRERDKDRRQALRAAVPAAYPAAAQIGPDVWLLDRQSLAMGAAPAGAHTQMWDGWDYAAGRGVARPTGTLSAPPPAPTQPVPPTMVPTTPMPPPTVQDEIMLLLANQNAWLTASEIASKIGVDLAVVRTEIDTLHNKLGKLVRQRPRGKRTKETYEYQVVQSVQSVQPRQKVTI